MVTICTVHIWYSLDFIIMVFYQLLILSLTLLGLEFESQILDRNTLPYLILDSLTRCFLKSVSFTRLYQYHPRVRSKSDPEGFKICESPRRSRTSRSQPGGCVWTLLLTFYPGQYLNNEQLLLLGNSSFLASGAGILALKYRHCVLSKILLPHSGNMYRPHGEGSKLFNNNSRIWLAKN